jgi:hypothetical protein
MSGGHFSYDQYKIGQIADEVEGIILKNGERRERRESWEGEYYYNYPPEVIEKFKEGLEIIRKAEIYAQRIDWLVSGDDGEESFLRRLDQDLKNLENNKNE